MCQDLSGCRWNFETEEDLVHHYKTDHGQSGNKRPAFSRFNTGRRPEVAIASGEEQFGRYGDLIPENLLWRAQENTTDGDGDGGGDGILIVTDLGLGEFHRKDSHSEVNPVSSSSLQAKGVVSSESPNQPPAAEEREELDNIHKKSRVEDLVADSVNDQ